jgi:hypothetical protein
MASQFDLNSLAAFPFGNMNLAAPTATATLSAVNSFNTIVRGVPAGAATYTTATAAEIALVYGNPRIGDTFFLIVLNASAGANTITVASGAGGTDSGVMTVVQNGSKIFLGRFTNVATPAFTLYSLGTTAAAVA